MKYDKETLLRGKVNSRGFILPNKAETKSGRTWLGGLHRLLAPYDPLLERSISPDTLSRPRSISLGKGLVINYREGGGAKKWENHWSETFCAPHQDRVNFLRPPF